MPLRWKIASVKTDRRANCSEVKMRNMLRAWFLLVAFVLATAPVRGQQKRALTFDDLMSVDRIGEPMISPDGLWVAYTVAKPDVTANRLTRNIWVVSTDGPGEPRQL